MLERFRRTPPTLRERIRLRASEKRRRNPLLGRLGDADQAALRVMRTRLHDRGMETAMRGFGWAGEWAGVWVLVGGGAAALDRRRRRRWLAAAAVGPSAVCLNFAVKAAVGRERPLIEGHPPLARAPSKLSFPSAHATSSVAAATALGRVEPAARPGLYALAAAICLSRPYLGMHYPSDVIAGVALGRVIGRVAPGVGPRARGLEDALPGATAT